MKYILQYFDDIIEENTEYYNKPGGEQLSNKEIWPEINKQEALVYNGLKEYYYSDLDEFTIERYLTKILKRIVHLKETVILNMETLQENLVIDWKQDRVNQLYNYRSIQQSLKNLGWVIIEEMGISYEDKESFYYLFLPKLEFEFYQDYQKVKEAALSGKELPVDIAEYYHINSASLEVYKDYFYEDEEEQIKDFIGLDSNYSRYEQTFISYYKRFYYSYLDGVQSSRTVVYNQVVSLLKKELKEIKRSDEKLNHILVFFINTSLCQDIIMDYFRSELTQRSRLNNSSFDDYINEIKSLINRIKSKPKYLTFHISNWEDHFTLTQDMLLELIGKYDEPQLKKDIENKDELEIDEKLSFEENAESLSLLFGLMCQVGLFDEDNKSKIGRVLSKSFKTKSKKNKSTPRTFADYMNSKNREYDHNNVPTLKRKLQKVISELNDIKIKKKLK